MPNLPVSNPAPRNIDALYRIYGMARSADLRTFIDHMIAIHPYDRLPARTDFDPLAVPQLLPGIVLVQVERDGQRTRFHTKLVGQNVVDAAPVRIANRYLDEFAAEIGGAGEILSSRQSVIDTQVSFLMQSTPIMPFAYKMQYVEYLHCPLAADGSQVDHILSFFNYERAA